MSVAGYNVENRDVPIAAYPLWAQRKATPNINRASQTTKLSGGQARWPENRLHRLIRLGTKGGLNTQQKRCDIGIW